MNEKANELMSPAQRIALDKAEAFLRAAGVKYALQLPDGSVLGELKLADPEVTSSRYKNRRVIMVQFYRPQLEALQIGQATVIHYPTEFLAQRGVDRKRFYNAVYTACWNKAGDKDDYIVAETADKTGVEVLRIK
jgi:hypothetical protein